MHAAIRSNSRRPRLRGGVKRLPEASSPSPTVLARPADVEAAPAPHGDRKYGAPREKGSDHGSDPSKPQVTHMGSDPRVGRFTSASAQYQPVQPTFARSTACPAAARPSSTDEPAANNPIPARAPTWIPAPRPAPPRNRSRSPHKPTLDEMGPAERGLPVSDKRGRCSRGQTPRAASSAQFASGGEGHAVAPRKTPPRPPATGRPGATSVEVAAVN
jgi:hypothetical protein